MPKQATDICPAIARDFLMNERHVKLFKNGRNQAVRISQEFELPSGAAIARGRRPALIIESAPPRSLWPAYEGRDWKAKTSSGVDRTVAESCCRHRVMRELF
jgi:virulence-associated protein VagC